MGTFFSTPVFAQPVTPSNQSQKPRVNNLNNPVTDAERAVAEAQANYEQAITKHNSMTPNKNSPNLITASKEAAEQAKITLEAAQAKLSSIKSQQSSVVTNPLTNHKGGRSRKIRLKLKMKKKKRAKTLVRR